MGTGLPSGGNWSHGAGVSDGRGSQLGEASGALDTSWETEGSGESFWTSPFGHPPVSY